MHNINFKFKRSFRTSNFLVLGILSIFFNVFTVGFFDIIDISILLMFLLTLVKKRTIDKATLNFLIFLPTYLLFTSMVALTFFGILKIEQLAFLYKWILPFILIYLLQSHFRSYKSLRNLRASLCALTVVLSIWCITQLSTGSRLFRWKL